MRSAQVGLIYGFPDRVETAPHIREVLARMGMNDSEAVASVGGGRALHGRGCNDTNSSHDHVCTWVLKDKGQHIRLNGIVNVLHNYYTEIRM